MKKSLPYVLLLLLDFYLLPVRIRDTGSAILMLLCIIPTGCFLCSVLYGFRRGIGLYYPLLVAALFVPSLFLYYNISAWVYLVVYGILAFLGEALGSFLSAKRKEQQTSFAKTTDKNR